MLFSNSVYDACYIFSNQKVDTFKINTKGKLKLSKISFLVYTFTNHSVIIRGSKKFFFEGGGALPYLARKGVCHVSLNRCDFRV